MATLESGMPAPAFSLPDQSGATVTLKGFRGRKLLVFFYPKADTPGCTTQSCAVRDARGDLGGLGVEVIGISPDEPGAQTRFDAKYTLGFPLLSDPDHAVADAWGAWGEKSMYGKRYTGIVRSAFLVDESGLIEAAFPKIAPKATVPSVMRALKAGSSSDPQEA